MYEALRVATTLLALTVFRARSIASGCVPLSGPIIFAPNHGSFMDHFLVSAFTRRKVCFMAKSQLFQPPAQWVYTHAGAFPLRRGYRDEDAFTTALSILARGGTVAMYCEGSRSLDGQLATRPKPGIGRLALLTGAPIVPVAIHGSARIREWRSGHFPRITVRYGDPIRYEAVGCPTRDQQMRVAQEIFSEIRALHQTLTQAGEHRQPRGHYRRTGNRSE
jgi:1-acyl-sn-glycerol-3-phosphate acyltransferase